MNLMEMWLDSLVKRDTLRELHREIEATAALIAREERRGPHGERDG